MAISPFNWGEAAAQSSARAADEPAGGVHTNLSGWTMKGEGRMDETAEGLLLSSDTQGNVIAMSSTPSEDFIYEADVMIKGGDSPDVSLVFRSDQEGWSSYMLQIVPSAGILRLKDAAAKDGGLRAEQKVSLRAGDIYHLKIKAEGRDLKVYWGSQYAPVIHVQDSAHATGFLGLHVWNGSALFQNIQVSALNSNLGDTVSAAGDWQPDIRGMKGAAAAGAPSFQLYGDPMADFVLESNVILGDRTAAGIVFREHKQGTAGYEVRLSRENDKLRVQLQKSDGTVISQSSQTYPSSASTRHHLEVTAIGQEIQVFIDGYTPPAVKITDGSFTSGYQGFIVYSGTAFFQDAYVTPYSSYYNEKYRPAYHYSPIRGSASDPNGLVYFEGEYHLFHQDGGQWAHAVSRDLLHWKSLPIALPWNDLGHVWSGSIIADMNNASGLFGNSGGKGMVAYYTSYNPDLPNGNQKIGLAYSTDRGRTWSYAQDHPVVIDNPGQQGKDAGGWDFRDPKVVRDEANNRWVMVVSGGDHIRFFTSVNLLDWTWTDNFGYGDYVRGGVWECPDLFQLPVDGTAERKWVLMISTGANPKTEGSDAEYFIGELTADGKFKNDLRAGQVLKTDWGKEFYASMSFSGVPDGRRILLAWMTNWDYPFSFPTEGWKGQMTIPREVTLRRTEDGVRLYQSPVAELNSLRSRLLQVTNREVKGGSADILKDYVSGSFEVVAEVELPQAGGPSEFGFRLRQGGGQETVVGYQPSVQQIFVDRSRSGITDFSSLYTTKHKAALKPDNGRITLRFLVDASSVEVFANDDGVVFSDLIFPNPSRTGMSFYSNDGKVKIVSLQVNQLQNTWREKEQSPARITMDVPILELSKGQSQEMYASYENGRGRANQRLVWRSSDPDIVQITSTGMSSVNVKAIKPGAAVIQSFTPNGKVQAETTVKVYDGTFYTNLTGWKKDITAAGWVKTDQGLRGSYTSDANYMAAEEAGNFTYEADMRLGVNGGAGSILFRASADGRSGYYFNLDPNLKAVRLFYKVEGRYEERQTLVKVPRFIQPGSTYHVKIQAQGPHIQIDLNGERVVDVMDGTFAEGHLGLNVFGGQVYYQNVNVSSVTQSNTAETSFVNDAFQLALYAEQSQNGEPVILRAPDRSLQKWLLIPNGDGTYSIRTKEGKAMDLDTGQNRLQLYSYLGYDNQRWKITQIGAHTVTITSVHANQSLEVSEDGTRLQLGETRPEDPRQSWTLGSDMKL
ncbi:family 16 glycoside hydrolase [Paenibacillus lacisoli]